MSKKDFKLTIKGIIQILEIEGIGSKQILKKRLRNPTKEDLLDLIRSAQEQLNILCSKG